MREPPPPVFNLPLNFNYKDKLTKLKDKLELQN